MPDANPLFARKLHDRHFDGPLYEIKVDNAVSNSDSSTEKISLALSISQMAALQNYVETEIIK